MKALRNIPLLAWLLVVCNVLVFIRESSLQTILLQVPLISGATFSLDLGHLLLMVGVILLYFEIIKATHTTNSAIVDHVLSTLVLIVFLIEFITVRQCGSATFLTLAFMALVDVVAGFTVTISSANRDFSLGQSQ